MHRTISRLWLILGAIGLTSCVRADNPTPAKGDDSAFTALQERGSSAAGMGVDQQTSVHQFDLLPDGARIELLRAVDDSAGVVQIRQHLRAISVAFAAGNFTTPAFVHMQQVPGTAVIAAKRNVIAYQMMELPRGGELRITTTDSEALAAIRDFIMFQRQDHHAGGADGAQHDPAHRAGAGRP